ASDLRLYRDGHPNIVELLEPRNGNRTPRLPRDFQCPGPFPWFGREQFDPLCCQVRLDSRMCVGELVRSYQVGDQCRCCGPVIKVKLTRPGSAELQRLHMELVPRLIDVIRVLGNEKTL